MKVPAYLRDQLAQVAAEDFGGVSLAAALEKLLVEHKKQAAIDAYNRLAADPVAWAEYTAELDEWDGVTGDGLDTDPREGKDSA